jgi:hypothetical protein
MVMGLIMIFYIEVQKGLLGAWWVASIPIFCVGAFIALKDSQISINHFNVNVVVICLTIVLVLLHIDIWYFDIFKIAFPFKGILSIWTEGAIFSMLLYLVSSKLKSEHSKFSWMGKNSAEMLFAQSISLSILRSSHLYIENNVLYLLGSIVMQILVVLIYERLFKCKFWRFDNA